MKRMPPTFFAIPFRFAGLGVVWRAMAERYAASGAIVDALLAIAAIAWLAVVSALRGAL
jgi:hypothetical protein